MNLTMLQSWKKAPLWENEDGSGGGGTPAPDGAAPPASPGPDAGAAPDYSFLPQEYVKDGKPDIDGFKTHLTSLEATKAQVDERNGAIPENADGYEFQLPDIDFKEMGLPDDFKVELNPDDEFTGPLLKEFGAVLHQNGIPQTAAKDFLGLLAKYEALSHLRGHKEGEAAIAAQREALGPKAEARVADVQRLLEARLAPEEAKDLMGATLSANALKGLEKLMSSRGLGGGGTPPPPARTAADDLAAYYENPS